MFSFKGENPTKMYYDGIIKLIEEGDECSPRGKLIKELRPASVEFDNPYNRVTFLGSRRVNPFFQIAEALWILSGRADVQWLLQFNANMGQFSDDGVWFNAPYGERLRAWNKNAAHGVIINPVDQMMDAYTKLMADKDTRQAVMIISNPMFDNAKYTIQEHGKDVACNLAVTFKIRHNKLNMTVFNRSNDLHWGLYGANLNQFTSIQECMMAWLKNSGKEEFKDLEIGTYTQLTDSLHIYLDDYGAKCTTDVLDYYKKYSTDEILLDLSCDDEPRMSLNAEEFGNFLRVFWGTVDQFLSDDSYLQKDEQVDILLELVEDFHKSKVVDDYWFFGIQGMLVYRLVKLDKMVKAMDILSKMRDCQWKISMMYFLKSFIKKIGQDDQRIEEYNEVCNRYYNNIVGLKGSVKTDEAANFLDDYFIRRIII